MVESGRRGWRAPLRSTASRRHLLRQRAGAPDTIAVTANGGGAATGKAIVIPPGQSKTIDVQLFSTGPTSGPWTVAASSFAYNTAAPYDAADLAFAWDRTSGQNGDVLHLTITVAAQPHGNYHTFEINSTLGTVTIGWPGLVSSE